MHRKSMLLTAVSRSNKCQDGVVFSHGFSFVSPQKPNEYTKTECKAKSSMTKKATSIWMLFIKSVQHYYLYSTGSMAEARFNIMLSLEQIFQKKENNTSIALVCCIVRVRENLTIQQFLWFVRFRHVPWNDCICYFTPLNENRE